jgi:hypothetical protein
MSSRILNAKGEPIVLNTREQRLADLNQRKCNALGFEIDITTLTTIIKKVTEQKFFEVAPADYLPLRVGQGAWSSNLVTYRSFQLADDFETGVINTGGNNSRLAVGDAGVDSVSVKVENWAKQIGWTLPELELAAKAGNWDLVTAKSNARKRNWDLGIQRVAFLGIRGSSTALGLLNQSGITSSNILTQPLSTLSPQALKDFCSVVLNTYRANCNRTAWPTHFIIPESDYLGLAAPSSADFPLKSVLAVLEETFQIMTKNKNFQILPLAYADIAYNPGATQQIYTLLNYDEESIRMDIPVDYTNTLANSLDNFAFQNVAYGQFTGVMTYRPAELLYLKFTP